MRIWLVQRAESTPHDEDGKRRLMRMGMLADLMQTQGHSVVWWTSSFDHVSHKFRFSDSTRKKVNPGYLIHYLKSYGYNKNKSLARFIDERVVGDAFWQDACSDLERPDIILASLPSVELAYRAVCYGQQFNVPVVLDIRDLWPDVFRDFAPTYLRFIVDIFTIPIRNKLRKACSGATAITAITPAFLDWAIKHSGRIAGEFDRYFPMAYPSRSPLPPKSLAYDFWREFGVSDSNSVLNVLFLGTFTGSFDFSPVFGAADVLGRKNVPVKFIFCGNGAKEIEIKKECLTRENCIFSGWIDTEQIQAILELSDVGLAPYINSPNFIKNVPNKLPEYMSRGLVVASNLSQGEIPLLLSKSGCGFVYSGDPSILAEKLANLHCNRARLNSMKKASLDVFFAHYQSSKIYGSMVDYFKDVVISKQE